MDFLGIGPMEILVIVVLILIVFGPNRLPEMARTIGKALKDVKSATSELGKSLSSELEEEELRVKQDIKNVTSDLGKTLDLKVEEKTPEFRAPVLSSEQEKIESEKNRKEVKSAWDKPENNIL